MKRGIALASALVVIGVGLALAQNAYRPGGSEAVIVVKVPADASVMVGDQPTKQKGTERTFYVDKLAPGWTYSHTFEVRWMEGDAEKKVVRTVKFRPGATVNVDLTQDAPPIEKKKKKKDDKTETKKEEPKKEEPKKEEPKKEVKKEEKKEPKKEETKEPTKEKKDPQPEAKFDGKVRDFLFTYSGIVKDLKPGQSANVWLPIPSNTAEQEVEIATRKLPADGAVHQEKQYGNKALYFEAKADKEGQVSFELVFRVKRKEVKTDVKANATLKPREGENITRFLEADKLVPIVGRPLEFLKEKALPKDQFAAAKVLYDVVNEHMKYSKEGKGWGRGDSVWACDSKFGNCTDFHSLFISMARGNKIPSKFEMGFPVPPKRGAGPIGGYHCWAWFMPEKQGWVPVDISEANRFPEMKTYYFGNLTEDRVQFTTGRDINLEPRQKGPALNFFIYPYVEVDGQPHPQEKITRTFAYQDVK